MTPLIFVAELLATLVIHKAVSLVVPKRSRLGSELAFVGDHYVRTLCALFLFSYSSVTLTVIAFLNCVPVGDARVVYSSPAIHCNEPGWNAYLVPAILFLVFEVILGPLALMAFLFKK